MYAGKLVLDPNSIQSKAFTEEQKFKKINLQFSNGSKCHAIFILYHEKCCHLSNNHGKVEAG